MKRLKLRGWVKVVMIILFIGFIWNTIEDVSGKLDNKYRIQQENITKLINSKEN